MAVRMPVFGLIAGAMYGYSSRHGWKLIQDKFQSLLVPMLTVGTIFAVTQYLVPGSNLRIQDLSLIHIVPVAHYWFLESLFLIFCLMVMVETLWPIQSTVSWCVCFTLSCLVYLFDPGFIWFSVLGATYLLPYFLIGFGMTRLNWDAQQERAKIGRALTLAGALLISWLLLQGTAPDRFSVVMLLAGLSMSAGLWSMGFRQMLLARIGDYSFAIFLFHVFFTSATRMALQAVGWGANLWVFPICMFAGILGPILTKKFLSGHLSWGSYLLGSPIQEGRKK
jgi:peptidoglycan/LPS O-acetylase OafA/YrhL